MNIPKLFRKVALIGLISSLAFSTLAGCGLTKSTETESNAATSSTSSATSSSEKVELEFFQMKPEAVNIYNEIISRFEKENPNIKINQNNVPDAPTVLQTRLASNDAPDIMLAYPNETEFKVYVSEGYMLDLSGSDALNNIKPDILNTIKIDGKDYSLPISLNTTGVFYNKKIFAEQGIDIPTTYAEFIDVCNKLKAAGITPLALSDKDNWTIGILANLLTGVEMGKDNADKFFADVIAGNKSMKESPEMGMIADRILELRNYGPEDSMGVGVDQAVAMFANGESAMFFNGIWENPVIVKANPDLDYSMFPFPGTTADKTRVIYGIDSAFSVSANTPHKAEALKFLEFLSRTENAQYFADNDNSPSCVKGVVVNMPAIQNLVKLLDEGKSFEWMHFKWPAGLVNQFNADWQILVSDKDKEAFLNQLDQDFKASNK